MRSYLDLSVILWSFIINSITYGFGLPM